jgi:hypothetical protein
LTSASACSSPGGSNRERVVYQDSCRGVGIDVQHRWWASGVHRWRERRYLALRRGRPIRIHRERYPCEVAPPALNGTRYSRLRSRAWSTGQPSWQPRCTASRTVVPITRGEVSRRNIRSAANSPWVYGRSPLSVVRPLLPPTAMEVQRSARRERTRARSLDSIIPGRSFELGAKPENKIDSETAGTFIRSIARELAGRRRPEFVVVSASWPQSGGFCRRDSEAGFRVLAVVDDFSECLALVADTSLSGVRVAREKGADSRVTRNRFHSAYRRPARHRTPLRRISVSSPQISRRSGLSRRRSISRRDPRATGRH